MSLFINEKREIVFRNGLAHISFFKEFISIESSENGTGVGWKGAEANTHSSSRTHTCSANTKEARKRGACITARGHGTPGFLEST